MGTGPFCTLGIVELERQCMRSVPCGLSFLMGTLNMGKFGGMLKVGDRNLKL